MESDTDDEVDIGEMSLSEDESSDSSLKSETDNEHDHLPASIKRNVPTMQSQNKTISSPSETSSCNVPSTANKAAIIKDEGVATYGPEATQFSVGANAFGSEKTTSASSSGQLCSPDLIPRTSGAEIVTYEKGIINTGPETTRSNLAPSPSGHPSIRPVGGSALTETEEIIFKTSADQVHGMAGALIQKAKESDFSLSMKTVQQELTGAKEVHINVTNTLINKPAGVTFGGDVLVGPPPQKKSGVKPQLTHSLTPQKKKKRETQGPPPHVQKQKKRTEKTFKEWTEGMVMTKAATTILNKITQGKTWVTVTGCPGEGKTTAGYLVLKHLHDRGREVFDVKTPDDYFKLKDTKKCVIMLNDIFGGLSYESKSMKKWQDVLSDVLALSEHKQEDQGRSLRTDNRKIPEVSVILISRLSVLNEASKDMGRYKHLVLGKDNVVNLTNAEAEASERMKIWKCHAARYNITIDNKIVREICMLNMSHGFPHCCRLFADMYSNNNQLNMKHFFSKPLDFLNQSMESLINNSRTGPLLREMLKNDGSLDLENIDDLEKRFQYSSAAQLLKDTYLTLNGRIIEFHHPSVYDSAAYIVCQTDPSFVINHCSLSFLNERVRVKGLHEEVTNQSHYNLLVDSTFDKVLLKRFQKEFEDRNIEKVLSHSSFGDESFASNFMGKLISSKDELSAANLTKDFFNVCDKHSQKSFLFLMTKNGSDKLLRYIHQYVELTEEEQREALFGVCEHSSVSSLEYILQRYKDINLEVTDSDNQTPLLISTQTRSQDMIMTLLARNVNVNITDKKGRSPLLNVCCYGAYGDGSVVKMLLEKGADATVTLQDKPRSPTMSPLDLACQEGHTNIVNVLMKIDFCVHENLTFNVRPLHYACTSGHSDVVSMLLYNGADINTSFSNGCTPLHTACLVGHVDVVSILVDKGADINRSDSDGYSPLHTACHRGHVDVVSKLVDKGADINTSISYGSTPFHTACYKGHVDSVSMLVDKGADINSPISNGCTPLHTACVVGHVDVVSILVDKGADINTSISNGCTPLHTACSGGHVDVVSILVDKGADINTSDSDGCTPLHTACYRGHVDVVSILVDKRADINTSDSDGCTPLHTACYGGHVDVVSKLVDNGADFNTSISNGCTPLHTACSGGHVDVVSKLVDKGADINTSDSDGCTPLHTACYRGHVDVVSILVDKGADINTSISNGCTPLHSACSAGHVDVVSILVDKGADFNTSDSDGRTPLDTSCHKGHVDVVFLLTDKGADIITTEDNALRLLAILLCKVYDVYCETG